MSESVEELVRRLRPMIEMLLNAHGVSPGEGRKLLEDLVCMLRLKRHSIAHPEAWLLASLHRAVQRADPGPDLEDDIEELPELSDW